MRNSKFIFTWLFLPWAVAAQGGPVITVPWNGFRGAVSFTYDDARSSQIPTLLPQLDAMGIKATFFISATGTGGDFLQRIDDWIEVAQNGHELANHTYNHVNLPADPQAESIIREMADYLRGLDPTVKSVTFAYPNCSVNGKAGIGSEDFISRSCGGTRYSWNNQPSDWMEIQGMLLTPTNTNSAVNAINSASSEDTWLVTIIHDVENNPDAYSVTPSDNQRMLDAAVSTDVWIDTYQNIGAYYRAHFVMDNVTASPVSDGWEMNWDSPHPKMPSSVVLKVELNEGAFGSDFVVVQEDSVIAPEEDGSYLIDFMKLSMSVMDPATAINRLGPSALLKARATADGIEFKGVTGRVEAVVTNIRGNTLYRGEVFGNLIPLAMDRLQGVLFLTLTYGDSRESYHLLPNVIH